MQAIEAADNRPGLLSNQVYIIIKMDKKNKESYKNLKIAKVCTTLQSLETMLLKTPQKEWSNYYIEKVTLDKEKDV